MVPFSINSEMDVATAVARLHQLMAQLKIKFTTLKDKAELNAMDIIAMENTWSNMRKKRRQEKFKNKIWENGDSSLKSPKDVDIPIASNCELRTGKGNANSQDIGNSTNEVSDATNTATKSIVGMKRERSDSESDTQDLKRAKKDSGDPLSGESSELGNSGMQDAEGTRADSGAAEPLLCGSLVVRRKEGGCVVELSWLRGRGGRDAAHQVLQYFKNNLSAIFEPK